MYEIRLASHKVEKELATIPRGERQRIVDGVRKLAKNPRPSGIKALAPNVYRLRIGPYRVIYKVYDNEKLILLGRFARRSERTCQDLRSYSASISARSKSMSQKQKPEDQGESESAMDKNQAYF